MILQDCNVSGWFCIILYGHGDLSRTNQDANNLKESWKIDGDGWEQVSEEGKRRKMEELEEFFKINHRTRVNGSQIEF